MSTAPDPRGVYFNSAKLGFPTYDYVCWIDVMGTSNQMLRSLPIAANFIFKLQAAALEARDETGMRDHVRLYPTIDGMYLTSVSRWDLQRVVNQTMCRCALTFLSEKEPFHRFLVRGAVAYGPVYHGADLNPEATYTMANNPQVRDAILLGLPIAQAHEAEGEAAPFGISVHSSARGFAPPGEQPFGFIWVDWFNHCAPKINPTELLMEMESYFEWQSKHTTVTGYKADRMAFHAKLAREFFTM